MTQIHCKLVTRCGWLLFCLALLLPMGCQSLSMFQSDPFKKMPVATEKRPVERVVTVWEPADGTDEQNRPCRGFNGRVMFFLRGGRGIVAADAGKDVKPEPPARINPSDEISIAVFDDLGTVEEQQRPIKVFKFNGAELETFLSYTTLGGEHDLFIPYTKNNAYAVKCALQVKYTPQSGRPVISEMVKVELPGTPRPSVRREYSQGYSPDQLIQQASHEELAAKPRRQMVGETLQLPAAQQPQLMDDQARLNARIQEMVGDYRKQQEPEYRPSFQLKKYTVDPRENAQVVDLRNPLAEEAEAEQPAAQPPARPQSNLSRHPLLQN